MWMGWCLYVGWDVDGVMLVCIGWDVGGGGACTYVGYLVAVYAYIVHSAHLACTDS